MRENATAGGVSTRPGLGTRNRRLGLALIGFAVALALGSILFVAVSR